MQQGHLGGQAQKKKKKKKKERIYLNSPDAIANARRKRSHQVQQRTDFTSREDQHLFSMLIFHCGFDFIYPGSARFNKLNKNLKIPRIGVPYYNMKSQIP